MRLSFRWQYLHSGCWYRREQSLGTACIGRMPMALMTGTNDRYGGYQISYIIKLDTAIDNCRGYFTVYQPFVVIPVANAKMEHIYRVLFGFSTITTLINLIIQGFN